MDKFANSIYEKTLRLVEDKKEVLSRIRVEQAKLDREAEMEYAKEKAEEKGKKEGIKEGKEKRNIEIATKLKNSGYNVEDISKITELSTKFIEKL